MNKSIKNQLQRLLMQSPYYSPFVEISLENNSITITGKVTTFFQKQMVGELVINFVKSHNHDLVIKNNLLVT